jgi:hypothetical protein
MLCSLFKANLTICLQLMLANSLPSSSILCPPHLYYTSHPHMFPDLLQQPFSRLTLGILFLSPISSLCSVSKPIGNLRVVLQFPCVSYINLSFQQVDCSDCYPLHASFLFGLFFDPEDVGDMCFQNTGLTFNRLHGFISNNIKIFMTTVVTQPPIEWIPRTLSPGVKRQ